MSALVAVKMLNNVRVNAAAIKHSTKETPAAPRLEWIDAVQKADPPPAARASGRRIALTARSLLGVTVRERSSKKCCRS